MEFEMKILDEIKKVPRETPLHDEKDRPKRSLKLFLFGPKKSRTLKKTSGINTSWAAFPG